MAATARITAALLPCCVLLVASDEYEDWTRQLPQGFRVHVPLKYSFPLGDPGPVVLWANASLPQKCISTGSAVFQGLAVVTNIPTKELEDMLRSSPHLALRIRYVD